MSRAFLSIVFALAVFRAHSADNPRPPAPTRETVNAETLRRYEGPTERGVDVSTLTGKTICGYQGWFNAEGDGMDLHFRHWAKGRTLEPGTARIDLWPDMTELSPPERFATGFKHRDGRVAEVFSSARHETVLRHFQWMRDYGIDGAFVQRFAVETRDPRVLRHINTVLAHTREGANRNGRAYAVMYDLSGLGANRMQEVIDDWLALRQRMRIGEDPAYLHHRGKPLVAVWGVGFGDQRQYTLEECGRLIEFLKGDGCSVLIGVPTYWRELKNDAAPDPALHDVLKLADVISPWTVGRFANPEEVARHATRLLAPDLAWCAAQGLDYLPVLFPGFSWHNMKGDPLEAIPRRKGEFLWSQFQAAARVGANMAYVAMFDEVDEGTAIFKCTNDVPIGEPSQFLTLEGLPSDYYLRLTGDGARMIRSEMPAGAPLPSSK